MIQSLRGSSVAALVLSAVVTLSPAVAAAATSPDGLWRRVDHVPRAAGLQRGIQPEKFRTFTLDVQRLSAALANVPVEFSSTRSGATAEITLPKPDGSFARFRIEEVALMEPALAAKHPGIRTFRGRDINDPTSTLQLDVNPKTVHAQVLSPSGSYYIDPYYQRDGRLYMSYDKSDVTSRGREFKCLSDGHTAADHHHLPNARNAAPVAAAPTAPSNPQSGKFLRTYRLACATSLSYSQYHGGPTVNVPDVLAALVTMNNRVSGIYELEFGVRMVLVANTEAVISTPANPGPYSDTPGDIQTNPAYLDLKIGEANYDIGHVVTTGSGGVAGLGVVCRGFSPVSGGSSKARGTTGINPPEGDPFWVDFVAHEMGHQFGGNHTFDGTGTNCGVNQNESTAYEPGSGSTIQAYAGICGNQNIQNNSDPYFHFASLNEMFGYITSGISSRPAGILLNKEAARATPLLAPEASPASGSVNPVPGEQLTWTGTAVGAPPALDDEVCEEGLNCDTFTLTVNGNPSDWVNKSVRIRFDWPNVADDYDIYVRKGSTTGPIVAQAATGDRPELLSIEPSGTNVGTGVFLVRVVYFAVAPVPPPLQFQYTAEATVLDQSNQGPAPTCAVVTDTGNTPPTVNAGPDFTIPARTPFALTATATDLESDPLTYCWEQADLGPGPKDANTPDDGVSPIIRSYLPNPSPTRVIPRWAELLANQTQTRAEKLPTTNRELNFNVTARDHRFGGFGMDQMKINVVDSGVGFEVTSPNTAGITYAGGSTQTVTWNVANTTSAPINTTHVNILLAPNATPAAGDPSFPIVLAANTPNDGSETVTIPMLNTTNARIMVQAVGNIYFDISNENFTITGPVPQFVSAASRKVHGTTPYDIPLPATAPFGIECRQGAGDGTQHTVVFTFNNPIVHVGSAVASEGAVAASGVNPSNPNEYLVQLNGVQSGRYLTVTLNEVNGSGTATATLGVLLGDTSGNGMVNSTDIGQAKAQSGSPVTPANFRLDVNVNDAINGSDISLIKAHSGTSIQ
jgi:hypothetical protein